MVLHNHFWKCSVFFVITSDHNNTLMLRNQIMYAYEDYFSTMKCSPYFLILAVVEQQSSLDHQNYLLTEKVIKIRTFCFKYSANFTSFECRNQPSWLTTGGWGWGGLAVQNNEASSLTCPDVCAYYHQRGKEVTIGFKPATKPDGVLHLWSYLLSLMQLFCKNIKPVGHFEICHLFFKNILYGLLTIRKVTIGL